MIADPSRQCARSTTAFALTRLALRVGEAAQALGVSADYFAVHLAPELRWVRRGAVKLVPVAEIEAWLEREAALTLRNLNQQE